VTQSVFNSASKAKSGNAGISPSFFALAHLAIETRKSLPADFRGVETNDAFLLTETLFFLRIVFYTVYPFLLGGDATNLPFCTRIDCR
jgi:hypothetical protein